MLQYALIIAVFTWQLKALTEAIVMVLFKIAMLDHMIQSLQ